MATFKAKDGTQIYYKDCGAGKPVLFSHGWPLDGDMWDSQLNYLAEFMVGTTGLEPVTLCL